ncbi:AMP-binding protein [Candidatus Methylopumilus rimovensis]|uniref:AMP-binding protein n=1 Tax=Candidatus Methylopumilus rimovensis TaxID=2588535 RepID=UPI0016525385|nr:AMP-binding protein [Candidatus Methylopumilus rimovensis]
MTVALDIKQAKIHGVLSLDALVNDFSIALKNRKYPHAPVGVIADNSADWIALDLATQHLGIPLIPIPHFFSNEQKKHLIDSAHIFTLFAEQENIFELYGFDENSGQCHSLFLSHLENYESKDVNKDIQKITFTSGTTSKPKGVCLSSEQQWSVAKSLEHALANLKIKKHLCLLPLSVLLENVAGVYTSFLSHTEVFVFPLKDIGFRDPFNFDAAQCLSKIDTYKIESIILLPQMLHSILNIIEPNDPRIQSLKFVALGGAKTPRLLIQKAKDLGLPIYEGYGLSECSSVVSLNLPNAYKVGSVGKPLSNRKIKIAEDHEIEISMTNKVNYLGEVSDDDSWFKTGDIGHIDEEGFLFIDGRKKNLIITSYGRNISPEWPESLLMEQGLYKQVMVIGDAQPYLLALILPSFDISQASIESSIRSVNKALPSYASILNYIVLDQPFSFSNGQLTENGRLKRDVIQSYYQKEINTLYESSKDLTLL